MEPRLMPAGQNREIWSALFLFAKFSRPEIKTPPRRMLLLPAKKRRAEDNNTLRVTQPCEQ